MTGKIVDPWYEPEFPLDKPFQRKILWCAPSVLFLWILPEYFLETNFNKDIPTVYGRFTKNSIVYIT